MGIEDGGVTEAIIEPADDDADWERCPCCGDVGWMRLIAAYSRGSCWVIYCGSCGKPIEKRWNMLP